MRKNTNNQDTIRILQKEIIKNSLHEALQNKQLSGNEGLIITTIAEHFKIPGLVAVDATLELLKESIIKRPNSTIPFRKNYHYQHPSEQNTEENKNNDANIRPNNFLKGKKNDNHDVKRFSTENNRTQYKYVAKKSTKQNPDIIKPSFKETVERNRMEEEKFESEFNFADKTNTNLQRFATNKNRAEYEYIAKTSTQQNPDIIKPSLKKPIELKPIEEETLESEINFADETNARAKNIKPIARVTSLARKTTEDNNIILQNYNVTNKIIPQIKKTKPAKNKTITLTEEEKAKKEEQRKADQARNQKREEELKKLAEEKAKAKFDNNKLQTKTKVKNSKQKVEKKNDIIDDEGIDSFLDSIIPNDSPVKNLISSSKAKLKNAIEEYLKFYEEYMEKINYNDQEQKLKDISYKTLLSDQFLECIVSNANYNEKTFYKEIINYAKGGIDNNTKVIHNLQILMVLWQNLLTPLYEKFIDPFIEIVLWGDTLECTLYNDSVTYCDLANQFFNAKNYPKYSNKIDFKCLIDIHVYLFEKSLNTMYFLSDNISKDTILRLIKPRIDSHKSDAEIITQNDETTNQITQASKKKKKKKKDIKKIDDTKASNQEESKESNENIEKITDFKNLDTQPIEDWSNENLAQLLKPHDAASMFDKSEE